MPRFAKRIKQEIVRLRGKYDVIVVSYGGAGTTMLAQVLGQTLRVNAPNSERDGILHARSPDHPVFSGLEIRRAIYVFADPPQAVLSIFNRGFQSRMRAKLQSMHRSRSEYLRNINADDRPITLDELLRCDRDPFQIEGHLQNWTTPESAPFPILCVKYDALFESKSVIADFVGRPEIVDFFPEQRSRRTRLDALKPAERHELLRLYERERNIYRALPEVFQPVSSRD